VHSGGLTRLLLRSPGVAERKDLVVPPDRRRPPGMSGTFKVGFSLVLSLLKRNFLPDRHQLRGGATCDGGFIWVSGGNG